MRRRLFLLNSTSSALAVALVGCGGGGSDGTTASAGASSPGAPSVGDSAGLPVAGEVDPAPTPPISNESSTPSPPTDATSGSGANDAPPPSSAASGSGYAFGSRKDAYRAGIKPSQSNTAMDALLATQYDAWKAARVKPANAIVAGGYAVQFSDVNYLTVSEGIGYGMLLAVVFAGHDPKAQSLFDGLLAVARTRYAYALAQYNPEAKYLMDWRVNADGTSAGDGWNAMDGDLDIAMALLMADRQWGSTGKWNYKAEALNTINALKVCNMQTDGTTKGLPSGANNRTSDYMVGHFRAFASATGDSLWTAAVDRAYWLLNYLQTNFSPNAGLMPDFVKNSNTNTPIPSPGYIGDGNANEGYYWWNACRNPWRFASDYLLSGDTRFAAVTGKMIDFFKSSSGGDPTAIGTGYALNGAKLSGGNSAAYSGPICAGACVDSRFQSFLDAMWKWNTGNLTTGYYDGEIQLLSMVVASGNWWTTAR